MRYSQIFLILFFTLYTTQHYAQTKKFLQIDLSGGVSQPILKYADPHMFAGKGVSYSGGFDYFFNKIGFGFTAGQFGNTSRDLFNDYVSKKYLETITNTGAENWNTKFILAGPTFKIGIKKLEWDIFAKGGLSQIRVPEMVFAKSFFNQYYKIYSFSGTSDNYQFAWNGGTRLTYKVNQWLGLQAKAEYFTTSFLSKFVYEYSYRNAQDGNKNGIIEDSEYFEAQKISHTGNADVNVVNVQLGMIFQLGKPAAQKITKMIPDEAKTTEITTIEPIENAPIAEIEEVTNKDNTESDKKEAELVKTETIETNSDEIPVINASEAPSEPIAIPVTTYEAPEAKYDAEAAEFLYKAGESYFATNDFENALPCFNKLKADPNYPRAKYMFALSLCAMGNCAEARAEYKDFVKTFKEPDSRTLEIIFASHLERCNTAGKLKNIKSTPTAIEKEASSKDNNANKNDVGRAYTIQFIAIKKPNANFPRIAEVGNISTEFYPNKSVFRYSLIGYNDIKGAATDLYKVRKLGFRDAFIAVYENGLRVNTLYHAK